MIWLRNVPRFVFHRYFKIQRIRIDSIFRVIPLIHNLLYLSINLTSKWLLQAPDRLVPLGTLPLNDISRSVQVLFSKIFIQFKNYCIIESNTVSNVKEGEWLGQYIIWSISLGISFRTRSNSGEVTNNNRKWWSSGEEVAASNPYGKELLTIRGTMGGGTRGMKKGNNVTRWDLSDNATSRRYWIGRRERGTWKTRSCRFASPNDRSLDDWNEIQYQNKHKWTYELAKVSSHSLVLCVIFHCDRARFSYP